MAQLLTPKKHMLDQDDHENPLRIGRKTKTAQPARILRENKPIVCDELDSANIPYIVVKRSPNSNVRISANAAEDLHALMKPRFPLAHVECDQDRYPITLGFDGAPGAPDQNMVRWCKNFLKHRAMGSEKDIKHPKLKFDCDGVDSHNNPVTKESEE